MSNVEPAVDPALEAAASALRTHLAARGVPADELSEPVVLALAVQQERIGLLHAFCHSLHDRLERVEELIRRSGDIPYEEYRLRTDRLRAQAEQARSVREDLSLLGTLRGPIDGPTRLYGTLTRALTDPEGAQLRAALASGRASDLVGLPITLHVDRPEQAGAAPAHLPEAPRFRHDCPDCVSLGRSADGAVDLYYCSLNRPGVVVRYGDDPGQIAYLRTSPANLARCRDSYLAEAYRRAVARGLVGGAGEGG